ncbi:MAG: aspartate/glutamate racemase family protein [Bacillota bacterium]|nr:aspartate/glutamate racemase family protein [Bacillota bacterium]
MSGYLKDRRYGYITPENRDTLIRTIENQQISGYSVGIVYIENVNYPLIPGNVVNAYTYDFPVRMKPVPNLTNDRLFNADPTIKDDIISAAKHMVEKEGVRAICSACGFFGNYHKDVAAAIDVPVAMSSIVQIPWIRALLKPDEKIGILTANGKSMNEGLLRSCGIENADDLVIKGMEDTKEFSAVVDMRPCFDNEIARKEVVEGALQLVEENDKVGAILLECSDMPPYAADVQAATQLPVFDFITLIKWLHNAVMQKPYAGWM